MVLEAHFFYFCFFRVKNAELFIIFIWNFGTMKSATETLCIFLC